MKLGNNSATFLFGVIFLGFSSSMAVSATDVLGDVNNQAIQLGNNGGSAPENGLGSDNGSSTKDKLKPQVDKGKNDETQFAFVGNGNGNSGSGRSNATKAVICGAVSTILVSTVGARYLLYSKQKDASGSEEEVTDVNKTQDKDNNVQPDDKKEGNGKKSMSTGLTVFLIIIAAIVVLRVLAFLSRKCTYCLINCAKKVESI